MKKFLFLILANFMIMQSAYAETPDITETSKTRFEVLSVKKVENNHVEVVTRKVGASGDFYSKRLVDCTSMKFKYLGEGTTIEEMEKNVATSQMAELVPDSISDFVSRFACTEANK